MNDTTTENIMVNSDSDSSKIIFITIIVFGCIVISFWLCCLYLYCNRGRICIKTFSNVRSREDSDVSYVSMSSFDERDDSYDNTVHHHPCVHAQSHDKRYEYATIFQPFSFNDIGGTMGGIMSRAFIPLRLNTLTHVTEEDKNRNFSSDDIHPHIQSFVPSSNSPLLPIVNHSSNDTVVSAINIEQVANQSSNVCEGDENRDSMEMSRTYIGVIHEKP